MSSLRSRICLGLIFYGSFKAFAHLIPLRPAGEQWDAAYFAGAATVDWLIFRITPLFARGQLCRDIESLLIASIATHAFGFALYMAYAPPSIHNWIIQGINYVLAIRLITTGGSDVFNGIDVRGILRGLAAGRAGHQAKEAQ